MKRLAAYACALCLVSACSDGHDASTKGDADRDAAAPSLALTRAQLLDPTTCKDCHPNHYREWSGSMHAYAAQDPVFIAMNKRGQRETNGELGDFCVKCHAPMAVRDKRTTDGLNLDQLPDKAWGVSCYFCHNVDRVDGDHNAMLHLSNDTTLRAGFRDPLEPGAHQARFSAMFEIPSQPSSAMCGACHDVVTQHGVHLERTFQEFQSGLFSKSADGAPPGSPTFESCPGCHMPNRQELAAVQGVTPRAVHEHLWPGIDLPLIDFPHRDALRSAIEDCQLGPASVGFFTLQVTPPNVFTFNLETNAGHNQPSGAAQDRRMWLEFMAYDAGDNLLDQVSSGNIADDEIEEKPQADPNLLMLRDRIYDAQGKPVHMFWQAEKSSDHPEGYESNTLAVRTSMLDVGTHGVQKQYQAAGPDGLPARVTARMRMRPIGLDVLQDLVDSGDLDPAIMAQMPTLTFGAQIEWTPKDGTMKTLSANAKADCTTYRCMLDPDSDSCAR